MALRHLLPLLLLLNTCQTGSGHCHVWPLASPGDTASLPELAPPCIWLTQPADLPKAPSGLATLDESQRQEFLTQVFEAERLFFEGDPEQARARLKALFTLAEQHPQLLPSGPKDRAATYRVLVTWMRLQFESGDTSAAHAVATWLAAHMPDQEPSVRTMPPELEVIASKALEKARGSAVKLTVSAPADCPGTAQVVIDGLVVGDAPLQTNLATGRHAMWLNCGTATSWVRLAQVTAAWNLADVRVQTEGRFSLHEGLLTWNETSAGNEDAQMLRSVAAWSGLEAVALPASGSSMVVATPMQVKTVPLDPEEPLDLDSLIQHREPLPWWAGALGVTAAALAGAGVWAHLEADDATSQTNTGIRDLRPEASQWQDTATGLYAAAAVTATCAAGLLVWQLLTSPTPAEPLFN